MHLHSAVASSDSTLKPEKLMVLGPEAGLTGANITEHDKMWDPYERSQFLERHADVPFFINFGMEVSTDLGHMTAIGLQSYLGGIRRAESLRAALDNVGGDQPPPRRQRSPLRERHRLLRHRLRARGHQRRRPVDRAPRRPLPCSPAEARRSAGRAVQDLRDRRHRGDRRRHRVTLGLTGLDHSPPHPVF